MAETLWTPPRGVTLIPPRKFVAIDEIRTVRKTGERVRVTVDDSGTVTHIEHEHTLDAIVRPKTATIKARPKENHG